MTNAQPGDVLRITARMKVNGDSAIENVFTFKWDALIPADYGLVMAHVADYLEAIYTTMNGDITDGQTYEDIVGFNVTQGNPLPAVNWPTLTAGTATGDQLPNGVAALTFFRTGLARIIGRKFWGVIRESANADGTWASGIMTAMAAAIAAILTPDTSLIDGGTLHSGVLDQGGTFREFTDGTASNQPVYQRRRRLGRGI